MDATLRWLFVGCACAALACRSSTSLRPDHVAPFPPGCENRTTGLIVVDLTGGANVQLPAWAESFARDYEMQVTVVPTKGSPPAEAWLLQPGQKS